MFVIMKKYQRNAERSHENTRNMSKFLLLTCLLFFLTTTTYARPNASLTNVEKSSNDNAAYNNVDDDAGVNGKAKILVSVSNERKDNIKSTTIADVKNEDATTTDNDDVDATTTGATIGGDDIGSTETINDKELTTIGLSSSLSVTIATEPSTTLMDTTTCVTEEDSTTTESLTSSSTTSKNVDTTTPTITTTLSEPPTDVNTTITEQQSTSSINTSTTTTTTTEKSIDDESSITPQDNVTVIATISTAIKATNINNLRILSTSPSSALFSADLPNDDEATTLKTTTTTTTTPITSQVTNKDNDEGVTSVGTTTYAGSTTTNVNESTSTEITLLVRIVFKGAWSNVCNKLENIRDSLNNLLAKSNDRYFGDTVKHKTRIVFHEPRCPAKEKDDESSINVLSFYVIDDITNKLDEKSIRSLPNLYENNKNLFNELLDIQSFELETLTTKMGSTTNTTAIIIGLSVGFIFLLLLAALIFVMRNRRGHFNYGERCRPVTLDAYNLDNDSTYSGVTRGKSALRSSNRSYGNPTFEDASAIPSRALNFVGLANFCNNVDDIANEFSEIPQVSSSIDELPAGAEVKNRYANVIPLPETRVQLQRLNNDPLTEYINANYVQGPKNASRYYIASQAPTETTVVDFWRMIWEQQIKVIVMLTDLVENDQEKCVEYVPPLEVSDCNRIYGNYQVTLKKRETKDKYAISSLQLKNLETNAFIEVHHIWYLWPVNGVPTEATSLLAALMQTRSHQRGANCPILVHCSPGTGRTGTFIALDLVIRQYEATRTVDVPRVVYTIRRNRAGAVQTKEQYTFVYQAVYQHASKLAGGAIDSN